MPPIRQALREGRYALRSPVPGNPQMIEIVQTVSRDRVEDQKALHVAGLMQPALPLL